MELRIAVALLLGLLGCEGIATTVGYDPNLPVDLGTRPGDAAPACGDQACAGAKDCSGCSSECSCAPRGVCTGGTCAPACDDGTCGPPGFAVMAGTEARFVLRDGPVSAWPLDSGVAVTLPGPQPAGGTLSWTLLGARRVKPRAERSRAGRLLMRMGVPFDWRARPSTYGLLYYHEVYPGVRLAVESRRHAFEYRFDIAPMAKASAIRLRYEGADEVGVEGNGRALHLHKGGRALREQGLRCEQQAGSRRVAVFCAYRVARALDGAYEVALDVGAYDRRRPLVVDPEIGWSSYLGGSYYDGANGVAVDGSRNVYVVGQTDSTDFPTPDGFDTTTSGEFFDAFVTKVDASAPSLVWSSYLGGSHSDFGFDVAVDGGGNVYVVGITDSTDFPTPNGFDTTFGGGIYDAFVTKVDASGSSLVWSSYLGGSDWERLYLHGVAVDGCANVYVVGETRSIDFPTPKGFDTTFGGVYDAFVTKIDASGSSLLWSSYLGGGEREFATSVVVDRSGSAYVVGGISVSGEASMDFPTPNGFDTTLGGWNDAFVTKVDASGSGLLWSSYLGGSGGDTAFDVAVDGSGNVYVVGDTNSTDFPTPGGFDTTYGGCCSDDAFVTKVDASGSSLLWSSYLGGGGNKGDHGAGIAVDGSGDVFVTGYTVSPDFPTPGGFDTTLDGFDDAFVTKVDASGSSLLWSSYLGGNGGEARDPDVAVDGSGNVYVVGETYSTDFPTPGGFDTTYGPANDAFVTRIVCRGDGICEPSEDACNCPSDCPGDCCGDGTCAASEDACGCSRDCPEVDGDGCCTGAENPCNVVLDVCPDDPCDACCSGGEVSCADPACPAVCGDFCCDRAEDCAGCPTDCGCPEPAPDMGIDASPDGGADASPQGAADVAGADRQVDGMGPEGVMNHDGPVSDAELPGAYTSVSACACAVGARPSPALAILLLPALLGAYQNRRRDAVRRWREPRPLTHGDGGGA